MTAWILRAVGVLMMLTALAVAVSRAPDRPVETLVARWAPPPSDFVEVKGQLVHLRDEGPRADALPIVLLHGTAASLHTWEGWAKALKPQRRVLSGIMAICGTPSALSRSNHIDPPFASGIWI